MHMDGVEPDVPTFKALFGATMGVFVPLRQGNKPRINF